MHLWGIQISTNYNLFTYSNRDSLKHLPESLTEYFIWDWGYSHHGSVWDFGFTSAQ